MSNYSAEGSLVLERMDAIDLVATEVNVKTTFTEDGRPTGLPLEELPNFYVGFTCDLNANIMYANDTEADNDFIKYTKLPEPVYDVRLNKLKTVTKDYAVKKWNYVENKEERAPVWDTAGSEKQLVKITVDAKGAYTCKLGDWKHADNNAEIEVDPDHITQVMNIRDNDVPKYATNNGVANPTRDDYLTESYSAKSHVGIASGYVVKSAVLKGVLEGDGEGGIVARSDTFDPTSTLNKIKGDKATDGDLSTTTVFESGDALVIDYDGQSFGYPVANGGVSIDGPITSLLDDTTYKVSAVVFHVGAVRE